ncbi:MAG: hypothetical protein LV479_07990 [Methylacidiphilales bacterium]|nr:hypothetical protein [Candidatus Methylacidiphilales bacterium]
MATNAPADSTPSIPAVIGPMPPSSALNPPQTQAPAPVVVPPSSSQPITASSAPAKQEDIYDIRPPFFYLRSWFWLWVTLAAIATVILFVLLWIWLKPHRLLSPKSAYELALEKLEKARNLLREDNPVPYAVLVSEAVRSYLSQRFQSPSTRRTTEEFLRLMENDTNTPLAEHRDLLRHFLQACDLVKFARYQPTLQELEQVQERAYSFVTATRPAPEAHRNGRHA